MKVLGESKWWVLLLTMVGLGSMWRFLTPETAEARLKQIPIRGVGFRSKEIALNDQDKTVFGEAKVVRRQYAGRGGGFLLTVIDGSRNRHAVHDPLYCLQGAGWQPVAQSNIELGKGNAHLMRLKKATGEESMVYYWYSTPSLCFTASSRYWWHTTLRRLTLGKSGKEPLLVVVQPLDLGRFSVNDFKKQYAFLAGL